MGMGLLPRDILLPVLEILQDDRLSLYRCSLVNRSFNQVATKILHSQVIVSPQYPPDDSLYFRDFHGISVSDTL